MLPPRWGSARSRFGCIEPSGTIPEIFSEIFHNNTTNGFNAPNRLFPQYRKLQNFYKLGWVVNRDAFRFAFQPLQHGDFVARLELRTTKTVLPRFERQFASV